MKYLLLTAFIFLTFFSLNAQSDFRNGYIILNNNDTVFGSIDYKGNTANAKKCIFKESTNVESKSYSPDEITAYCFTNSKYYISKTVVIGDKSEQIFLEYLINGIVDIFYYRDVIGEHYLVDNGTGNLFELKNEEKEVLVNDIRYIKESKEYIGVLKAIFKESPTISKKVETLNLNHKALITLTRDYHNEVCSENECVIYEKNLLERKSTIGVIFGLNGMYISETGILADNLKYLRNSNFGFELVPTFGFYYKVNLPLANERLYFQYEGTYSYLKLTTSNSYIELVNNLTEVNDISLKQNIFNNLVFLKYEFPKGKIRPTFQIGGFAKYFFNPEYNRKHEKIFPWGETYYTEQFNDNPFSNIDIGINFGAGLKTTSLKGKELYMDFRYQKGFGLIRGMNTNTFSMNLGFQIW